MDFKELFNLVRILADVAKHFSIDSMLIHPHKTTIAYERLDQTCVESVMPMKSATYSKTCSALFQNKTLWNSNQFKDL